MNVYSGFIYNLSKAINNFNVLKPMTRQVNCGTSIHEILLRKKITDTCNDMKESQMHYSKQKKPDSRGNILSYSMIPLT